MNEADEWVDLLFVSRTTNGNDRVSSDVPKGYDPMQDPNA
jgi:hypothetical protein